MQPAAGLSLAFTRCNAAERIPDWNRWMVDTHVPAMAETPGVRAASHFALSVQPTPGMPSVGFSHVTLYEIAHDADLHEAATALATREDELRDAGELDPNHCVIETDLLEAHGRWNDKPPPSPDLTAHILAYVLCNDSRVEAEWDAWNDDVHMPDMLASEAFTGVSRWSRVDENRRRARHLTLYDVGPIGVDEAVSRSAAVMPGIVAAGRKHASHVGALTVTLVRASRAASLAARPDAPRPGSRRPDPSGAHSA